MGVPGEVETLTDEIPQDVAIRLLRILYEKQAKKQVGVIVSPGMPEAHEAGLEYGSNQYDNAIEWLVETGALIPDENMNILIQNVVGQPKHGSYFRVTKAGESILHPPKKPSS